MANYPMQGPSPVTQLIAPDIAAQQLQLQRQQQMADILRQQAMEPMGDTQVINGWAVKKSPFEGLAKVLQGYMSGQNQQEIDSKNLALAKELQGKYSEILGGSPMQNGTAADLSLGVGAAAQPNTTDASGDSVNNGGEGPTVNNAQRMGDLLANNQRQVQNPNNPYNTGNMLKSQVIAAMGGEPAAQSFWKQYDPTDATKMAMAAGVDPRQANADALRKTTYIPPVAGRPGGVMNYADGRQEQMPTAIEGAQAVKNPDGTWSYRTMGGSLEAMQNAATAQASGKAAFDLKTVYNPDTKQTDYVPATQVAAAAGGGMPTGNNFGNLRPQGASTGFQQFSSPQEGLAAIDKNLQSYGSKGINTLSGIISRWAPPSENNTPAYIADVSKRLGIDPNQPLDMNNPAVRQAIGTGIMLHEQGPSKIFGATSKPMAATAPMGTETGQNAAQTELSKKWSDLNTANSQAQTTSSYLQNIKSLATKAATGPFSAKADFVNGLISTFVPGEQKKATDAVTANDLLEKYQGQIIARLSAGGMATDAARALLASAYPGAHMNLQAINEAVDNLVGSSEMTKAKAALLAPHATGRDPVAYQQKELVFDQNADPRLWQYKAIAGTPQGKVFLQNTLKQDPQFLQKAQALHQIGAF